MIGSVTSAFPMAGGEENLMAVSQAAERGRLSEGVQ